MVFLDFWWSFVLLIHNLILRMRPWTEDVSSFAGRTALKINRSVKTPWHNPSMGVAHYRTVLVIVFQWVACFHTHDQILRGVAFFFTRLHDHRLQGVARFHTHDHCLHGVACFFTRLITVSRVCQCFHTHDHRLHGVACFQTRDYRLQGVACFHTHDHRLHCVAFFFTRLITVSKAWPVLTRMITVSMA